MGQPTLKQSVQAAVANDGVSGSLFEFKTDGTTCKCMAPGSVCFRYVDPAVKRFRLAVPEY